MATYSPAKVVRELQALNPVKALSVEEYNKLFQAKCHERFKQFDTFPIDKAEQCLVLHFIAEQVDIEMTSKYRVKEQL